MNFKKKYQQALDDAQQVPDAYLARASAFYFLSRFEEPMRQFQKVISNTASSQVSTTAASLSSSLFYATLKDQFDHVMQETQDKINGS